MYTRRTLLSLAARWAGAAAASRIPGTGEAPASLSGTARAHNRLFGSAVDIGLLRTDAAYRALLAAQCSIVVAEGAMKWPALHPAADTYSFDQADALFAFTQQHNIAVRGHTLCWHEAVPDWLSAAGNPGSAAQLLTSHIRTVVGRYKGRVRAWDVVNEAISVQDGQLDGLRDSPWYRWLGAGYLDLAFRTARAADPHALLTYNDYGIEYDRPAAIAKRSAVLTLLRRLKAAGTPIDAMGIQSHLDATTAALGPGIVQFTRDVRALGLKVFLTELDVNDDNLADDDSAARDAAVARVYRQYVTTMVTEGGATDILTWGLSDNHSWLNQSKAHQAQHATRTERALPFDEHYQPTPAFYALRGALTS